MLVILYVNMTGLIEIVSPPSLPPIPSPSHPSTPPTLPPPQGPSLAHRLIDCYFALFKMLVEGTVGHAADRKKQKEEAALKKGRKGAEAKRALKEEEGRDAAAVSGGDGGSVGGDSTKNAWL